jgi:hypothetical protein
MRASPHSSGYICSRRHDGCGDLLSPIYSILTDIHEYTLTPDGTPARSLDPDLVHLIGARPTNREAFLWLREAAGLEPITAWTLFGCLTRSMIRP